MAQIWMHNGFLQVEGDKMSKSTGNFVTIHDLLGTDTFGGRAWPGEVLRLAMLRTPLSPADRLDLEGARRGGADARPLVRGDERRYTRVGACVRGVRG